MYRLTPRMLQHFEQQGLQKFHDLFSGGRCAGWQQEELIVAAIKADTQAQHHVLWKERGHDDKADIQVKTNGETHPLQIKSGEVKGGRKGQAKKLVLSGHRLGRFDGDLPKITDYLNSRNANVIAVPYKKTDNQQGRTHTYTVSYVDIKYLKGLQADKWEQQKKRYEQTNAYDVEFSLNPSMSWQVWWRVPLELVEQTTPISIR